MLKRKPYTGSTRQLLLAFDIGTTYSGISYCMLEPGDIPQIQSVTKFPGQGQVGELKVPSIMYYDQAGNLKAVGGEAQNHEVVQQATSEKWVKLEWWKLHLRPKHLSSTHITDSDVPPLPLGKSIVDVFADFTKYLFKCAKSHIKECYLNYTWESVKDEIQFIFTHPNGWEGAQQQQMRRAIERAGLVPSTTEGRARVRFLTEGEAGLHFCIWDLFASKEPDQTRYPRGQGVVVIDAGGGTIDLSMYSMKVNPTSFVEIAPAECRLQGAVFVSHRAKGLLQKKLAGSSYSSAKMIQGITDEFYKTTISQISSAKQPAYIQVGNYRENDEAYGIKAGMLTLPGKEATQLFDDSIRAVTSAFEEQSSHVTIPITMAFLIGGFGGNDWLSSQLDKYFKSKGIEFCRPNRARKAVPDGALSFFIDNLVKSRVARATYGVSCNIAVNRKDPEHLSRKDTWYENAAGEKRVRNAFQAILRKGVQVGEQKEFSHPFEYIHTKQSDFGNKTVYIKRYLGTSPDPKWDDRDQKSFSKLCDVRFNLREAAKSLSPIKKVSGQGFYYRLDIKVIILFGGPEFSAQVAWKVDGVEKRSRAEMIYSED